MKKILILLLTTAIASFVQAGSVEWRTNALYFDEVQLKNLTSGICGYLIYLEKGVHEASYTVDATFDGTSIGPIVSSDLDGTPRGGFVAGTFAFENITEYFNGDVFTILVSYNDGVDTWWNLSGDTRTIAGLDPDLIIVPSTPWTMMNINSGKGTDGTLVAGGGWVRAVPEPATASLALLGVALLIKRRRA